MYHNMGLCRTKGEQTPIDPKRATFHISGQNNLHLPSGHVKVPLSINPESTVIDMTKSNIQLRGHCQCCGNDQALRTNQIAHHGYTVKNGWFQGACHGFQYAPVEASRDVLDRTVEAIRDQVTNLREGASLLSSKANWPKTASVYNRRTRQDETVTLADLPEHKAQEIIDGQINQRLHRANVGEAHVAYLLEVAKLYHGKPLIEVPRDAGPEPINPGDKVTLPTRGLINPDQPVVAKCRRVQEGRVYYTTGVPGSKPGTLAVQWVSTRQWRIWKKANDGVGA